MNIIFKLACGLLFCASMASANDAYTVSKDIVFKNVNGKNIALDLYKPTMKSMEPYPLLVWVHGGAWKRGSKDAIPSKNPLLLESVLKQGYALASVDYRLSGEATFPAPLLDINDAIHYLHNNADQLGISVQDVIVMGRSAGGHLACLLGATNTSAVNDIYTEPAYNVKAVISFFGPTDLIALGEKGNGATKKSSVSRFLGDVPSIIPEVARKASVVSYIDEKAPPFMLLHGDQDKRVPVTQSEVLKSKLDSFGVDSVLRIEKGVGHSARIFDSEKHVPNVIQFIKKHMPSALGTQ